jgi:hypothetical protein
MTPNPKSRRFPTFARRAGRALARLAAAGMALRLGAAVAGTWPTATIAAAVLTVGAVRWWARVMEGRLLAPRPQPTSSVQLAGRPVPAADEERHLAFAQALAVVVAHYLADCQHQADQPGGRQ